jgi:hypothetical protein
MSIAIAQTIQVFVQVIPLGTNLALLELMLKAGNYSGGKQTPKVFKR